jgi:hypothetical protein
MPGEFARVCTKQEMNTEESFLTVGIRFKNEKQQQKRKRVRDQTSSYCSLSDDKAREKIKSLVNVSFISRRVMEISGQAT